MIDKAFNRAFFVLSAFVFIVVTIRAIMVPFCHDEMATFIYYIQTGNFLPYASHVDANNHVLNSFLAWICSHLFGDSPFSLRLPNLLGLLVLILAVYRLTGKLTYISSKTILVAGLLLSFHWLSFFNVCRGYGMSMALMLLAFSYIPNYIEDKKLKHVFKIYFLLSLAVCANLTLVITVIIITGLICIFQLYRHVFFKAGNIIILCIHIVVILFWVKYSFFLQHSNSLYAGEGNSYWNVTFVSLIYTIVGKQSFWINISVVSIYIALMAVGAYFLVKNIKQTQPRNIVFVLFLVVLLNGLIIGFYLLKKLCGINFPEDRTGLFFYVLFILNAAFIIDTVKPYFSNIIAVVGLVIFTVHFALNINFRKHSLDMYDVMPERFYTRLLQEQNQSPERITIGGNRFSELFFAFMNYRHDGALNLLDAPHNMAMNVDYCIGLKKDRKYYAPYYQEIDTDADYGFTLLKRKQPLIRKPLFTIGTQELEINKGKEYSNLFSMKDTVLNSLGPLLVECNFKVTSGDMPSLCWFVLSLDTAEGKTLYYNRIPMNWVKANWPDTAKNNDLILETGPLPAQTKIHRLVCYIWNFQGQQLKITMNSIKVFQIEGFGANVEASESGKLTIK